jgi:hypothetical protein
MMFLPIRVHDNLIVELGASRVQLSPEASIKLAERLLRLGTRRIVDSEYEAANARRAASKRELSR